MSTHQIAWYPENERLLAFGTSEGRVGVIDVIKHNVRLFRQYHRNTVYKLEWGPVSGNTELGLFSCAEGELVVYDMTDFEKSEIYINIYQLSFNIRFLIVTLFYFRTIIYNNRGLHRIFLET